MNLTVADKKVLGWLEGAGSSLVSIKQIARDTQMSRVAVRCSLNVLADKDIICRAVQHNNPGNDYTHVLHIHPERAEEDSGAPDCGL